MKVLGLAGTAFLIISLLSTGAVVSADVPEYTKSLSSSTRQAFTPSPRNENPNIMDREWLSSMQRDLAAYEYHASENGHGLQAPNRAQNLRTYFEPTGVRLYGRASIDGPALAGLSLARVGRGAVLKPVKEGKVTYQGARIEIRRDRILEWYENSAQGLEQGFTIEQPPQGKGSLVLELAISSAEAALDNSSVLLTTDQGRRLRYAKLIVEDATGQTLNSRLEVPSPSRIHLVIEDAGANYPLVIDPILTAVPDTILESNDVWDQSFDSAMFGASAANAGDVNGDGFDDVVIGAHGWDNGLFDEGAAFVFLGSANGIVGADPSTANAFLLSDEAAVEFGWSVSGAGDVNGDGFADIIVGAHFYRSILPGTTLGVDGAAFVFLGSPTGITGSGPTTAHASIFGPVIDSRLGHAVSAAGDVNGDGFGDIILGMPRLGIPFPCSISTPPTCSIPINDSQGAGGAALIFLGSPAGIIGSGIDDADYVILPYPPGQPVLTSQQLGADVAAAGDVNNDGFDDVIVGAAGYGVVFHGSLAGIIGTYPGTADATISSDAFVSVGALVSGAGDVNGDGFDDVLMASSALVSDPNVFNRGALMAFAGSASGITATGPADALSFIVGEEPQNFGWRFSGAGDIDNDGFADVIVGAGGYNGGLGSEGVAYIFRGSTGGLIGSSVADAYVRLEPGQSGAVRRGNKYGFSVSGGGDINGDGFADVLMGVGLYDAGQTDEGAVFVYHGGSAPINPNQPPVAVAGADQVVVDFDNIGSATFTVDGSASFDLDGTIVAYAWLEGETLLGTSPVLTAALPASGDHGLVLTVTDDAGITRGDAVTIRVEPAASTQILFDSFTSGFGAWVTGGDVTLSSVDTFPTPPQVRLGSSGAFLSRSIALPIGSTGMTLSFWGKASQFSAADEMLVKMSVDGGPFTTIHTVSSASSDDSYVFYGGSAIPIGHSWFPATASNIVLRFESNMTTGRFFVDDVKLRAISVPPGTPPPPTGELPVANAGGNIAVDDNDSDGFELVFLDGTLSADADGFIVSYEWFEVVSDGGTSMLGTGATLGVSFARGDHTVRLIVTDNDGGSAGSDPIVVTVNQALAHNQPPVANASAAGGVTTITDFDGDGQEFVLLEGRASSDADGTIVNYTWTENGNVLSNVPGAGILQEGQLKIILPIGVHTITLTVTDNQGAMGMDTVVITVVANGSAPTIDNYFATPTSITAGESVTLSWLTTGADSVSINGGASLPADGSTTVSPTTNTIYTLTATGAGGSSSFSLLVTVIPAPPGPPTVDSFTAAPTSITNGGSANLSWTTTGADSVSIDNGVGAVVVDGNFTVTPGATTTYTLTATGPGGSVTSTQTVSVQTASAETLNITNFEFRGDKNEWRIAGTSSIPGPGNTMTIYVGPTVSGSPALGTANVNSLGNWEYRERDSSISPHSSGMLSIQSSQGGTWEGITGVGPVPGSNPPPPPPPPPPALPTVDSFSAVPTTITAGNSAALTWTTTNADSVSINGGASQPANGSSTVSPITTTTYTLIATGPGGTASSNVTVTVNSAPTPPPSVDSFSAVPATITDGASSTLSWTTTDATSVDISGVGSGLAANGSATVSPTTTTIYTLTATGAGGTAGSSVTVTVNSSAPPQGSVSISGPASINRGDNTSFTVTLTNTGNSTISGAQLSFTVNPNDLLKDVSPGSSVAVGDIAPGGSVSQTWNARGDNEGSGTVTAGASSGGTSLDTVTHSLTVIK